jgi:Ca-activated chloride channel homolog
MQFAHPHLLYLLFIIPLLFFGRRFFRKKKETVSFPSLVLLKPLPVSLKQKFSRFVPPVFLAISIGLLIIALARPQYGKEEIRDISKGVAIQMVLDRSGSMATEIEYEGRLTTRFEAVKSLFSRFVEGGNRAGLPGRPNDLIGFISFARYSDTVWPLSLSHGPLFERLESLHIVSSKSEDGTAIGDAIALAAARLKQVEAIGGDDYSIKSKIIILLTDGENNSGKYSPVEAAELAKKWGIKIYAIGIGGSGSITIKTPFGDTRIPSRSEMNTRDLEKISAATGGIFRKADDGTGLWEIYREIDALEKSEVESLLYTDYKEAYSYFGLTALLFFLIERILSLTVLRKLP